MNDLFREALRCYIQSDSKWDETLKRTRAAGHSQGIKTEADGEHLSDEFRHEKRQLR